MTEAQIAALMPRLYSETEHDARGNFHHEGDLFRPGEALPALKHRIDQHLTGLLADTRFSVRADSFAGGRKIIVELLDSPTDLTDEAAARAFHHAHPRRGRALRLHPLELLPGLSELLLLFRGQDRPRLLGRARPAPR